MSTPQTDSRHDTDALYDTSAQAITARRSALGLPPGKVLAWITPTEPWGRPDPPEEPIERAAHAALLAVADFYVAIVQAKTPAEALRVQLHIEEVVAAVETASRAALEKADRLCV